MKARRSLNLLVAAAGLVFLSGCATETLTDSAFWSYLPFTSSKGGKGTGGHAGDVNPQPAPTAKPEVPSAAQPKLSTVPQRSTDPNSEDWNEPVTPTKDAGPLGSLPQAKTPGAGSTTQLPVVRDEASKPKTTPSGMPVRTDIPTVGSKIPGPAPALPRVEASSTDQKNNGVIRLPNPTSGRTEGNTQGVPTLGDPAAPSTSNRQGGTPPHLPEVPEPSGKGKRTPLRLPELLVNGIGPTTIGKPTVAELPKRSPSPKPSDGLNLPPVVIGEAAVGNAGPGAQRLPKALTNAPERRSANATTLPLPSIALDSPAKAARAIVEAAKLPGQPSPAIVQPKAPALAVPEAPPAKSGGGSTLTGSIGGGSLPTKTAGTANALPSIEPSATLPLPPIPAPFRLSEWISNDALHQAWRRQQSERAQVEPQLRSAEQQRLRLILDTYLLREKPAEKAGK
jgi:hypothetical protein